MYNIVWHVRYHVLVGYNYTVGSSVLHIATALIEGAAEPRALPHRAIITGVGQLREQSALLHFARVGSWPNSKWGRRSLTDCEASKPRRKNGTVTTSSTSLETCTSTPATRNIPGMHGLVLRTRRAVDRKVYLDSLPRLRSLCPAAISTSPIHGPIVATWATIGTS